MSVAKIQITGGAFQDFEGNPLSNGYLTMQLSHDEQVSDQQIFGGFAIRVPLDVNGNVSGVVSVWATDSMNPANAYYIVNAYRFDGTQAWLAPQYQLITSPGPFDLGTWVPNNPPAGGAPVGSILLQNNSVNNSSQEILNLAQGSGISITDLGDGELQIASSASASTTYMISGGSTSVGEWVNANATTLMDTALRVGVIQFNLGASFTSTSNTLDTSGASNIGGGSSACYGIYNAARTSLLWTSGQVSFPNSGSVATARSFSVPALSLTPGTYYFAWTTNDNGNTQTWGLSLNNMSFTNGTSDANIINNTAVTFGYAANPATDSPTLTLPATLGALTAYSSGNSFGYPMCMFR
jgi:hypothetical protein